MFYESEEIDNKLVCMRCSEHFDVPKTIPCGATICEQCENEIWNESNKSEVKCPLCKELHTQPQNGFPVNRLVQNLLRTQPHCAYNPELYRRALDTVDQFEKHFKNLKEFYKLESNEQRIRQHCENLRGEVCDMLKERQQQLNDFRNLLIEEIDEYEETRLESLKRDEAEEQKQQQEQQDYNKKEIEKLIDESDPQFKEWKKSLKRLDLGEEDIRNIQNKAKDLDNRLLSRKRIGDYCTFSGEPLVFQKSKLELHLKHLGELQSLKPTKLDRLRIKPSPSVNIGYKDTRDSVVCQSSMTPVNSDKLAIVYLTYTSDTSSGLYTYQVQLRLYNLPNGTLLNETTELHNREHISCLSVSSLPHDIYLLFQDQEEHYWLRNYDFDLRLCRAIQLDYQPVSVHTCNKEIYVISNRAPFVHVYDRDFKEIRTFGQDENPNEPFYMKNRQKIQFQTDLMFVYDDDDSNVYVILRDSGLLLKKIKTNQIKCQFQVDQTLRIVLMNASNKTFYVYDLNGDLVDEFEIKGVDNLSIFTIAKDGSLIVNDNEGGSLHMY